MANKPIIHIHEIPDELQPANMNGSELLVVSNPNAASGYDTNKVSLSSVKEYVRDGTSGGVSILDVYPIGSVYISVDSSFDPNIAFEGTTWEKFGQGKCLWGADGDVIQPQEDSVISAGLPNIKGSIVSKPSTSASDYYEPLMLAATKNTGALSTTKKHFSNGWAGREGDGISAITLDASKSNPIYGNSTTVQPPAIKVIFWKRIA